MTLVIFIWCIDIISRNFADENNRDLFGILVDETGSFIGDEVHLTSQIGNEYIQNIKTTDDGGFEKLILPMIYLEIF